MAKGSSQDCAISQQWMQSGVPIDTLNLPSQSTVLFGFTFYLYMYDRYFTQLHHVILLHLLLGKSIFPIFSFYYVRLSGNLWLAFNPAMCNEVLFASGKVWERRIIWQSEAAFFSKEIMHNAVLFCQLFHCHEEVLDDDSWKNPFRLIHQNHYTIGRVS